MISAAKPLHAGSPRRAEPRKAMAMGRPDAGVLPRAPALVVLALLAALLGAIAAAAGKPSYYEVLDVPKDADAKAIKSAYRKMALKWHPDKHPDNKQEAEEKFREVAEAYEVLSDPERRKRYDLGGDGSQDAFGGGQRGGNFDFGDFFGGFGGGRGGFKDPKDLFKEMFGDADPFANFDKFFDDVHIHEEARGAGAEDAAEAQAALEKALASLYGVVGGIPDPAGKAREILKMPKWAGKERKLHSSLKKKYTDPRCSAAFDELGRAVDAIERSRGGGGGGGGFGGGFGGFDMGGFGDLGGFGNLGGFDFGGAFGGFGGGGGGFSSMSFSSSFSTSSGGKTVKQETKIVNGKRVTKTIESDAGGTRATLEEEAGGRIRRQTGTRRAEQERLAGGASEEM